MCTAKLWGKVLLRITTAVFLQRIPSMRLYLEKPKIRANMFEDTIKIEDEVPIL